MLLTAITVVLSNDPGDGKRNDSGALRKTSAFVEHRTLRAALTYATEPAAAAAFQEHLYLDGQVTFPNSLYQGFVAVSAAELLVPRPVALAIQCWYDTIVVDTTISFGAEFVCIDTVFVNDSTFFPLDSTVVDTLTSTVSVLQSSVGRTNAGDNLGDNNDFLSYYNADSSVTVGSAWTDFEIQKRSELRYFSPVFPGLVIRQRLKSVLDSSNWIVATFVVSVPDSLSKDTLHNVRLMFGYDGDIGSSTGGAFDDRAGYVGDDSTAVVFVNGNVNDTTSLYGGIALLSNLPYVAGNVPHFHENVNQGEMLTSQADLGSYLLDLMTVPSNTFEADSATMADWMVYLVVDLGTIAVSSPDSVEFVFVNGKNRQEIVNGARLVKTVYGSTDDPKGPAGLPKEVRLLQNYPNPFNPVTRIMFELPRADLVDLTVFNVLGQKIITLANGFVEAGRHEVVWNGMDGKGKQVASGLYLYRLRTVKSSYTGKMLFLK